MEKRISVIIPVYKAENSLDRCVESIVNQSYQNLQIILVDDGSPDNCPQLCDSWAQRDSRICVIHKENGGPSAARNMALDIATGDYLYFVDSDDYVDSRLCEAVTEIFKKHDVDVVAFNSWRVNENGDIMEPTESADEAIYAREAALEALMQSKINHYVWNKMYKCSVFDGIRFPEGRLWEDVSISYKLIMNADRIYCCQEKYYYYCEKEGSIVATINEKALRDIFLARYESYLAVKDQYPQAGKYAFDRVILAAINLYDRSLWAAVDRQVLTDALLFLQENRKLALERNKSARVSLYYSLPKLYTAIRIGIHKAGCVVKRIRS